RMANASWLKRSAFRVGHGLGTRAARQQLADGRPNLLSRALHLVAWVLVHRTLRRHLGLAKVRHALSGAAPIAPEVLEFFLAMGVTIHEAYGMTENTAVATATLPGRVRFGSVGQPQPGIELALDEGTGDVLTRHPGPFAAHWRKPGATAASIG